MFMNLRLTLTGNGDSVSLGSSEDDLLILDGFYGLDDPEFSLSEVDYPGLDGGDFVDGFTPTREIFLPLVINRHDADGWRETKNRLRRILSPYAFQRGVPFPKVRLEATTRWGTRTIEGRRVVKENFAWSSPDTLIDNGRQAVPLILRCTDPWWHSAERHEVWMPTTPQSFGQGGFPLRLSGPGISEARAVDIEGDAITFPRFDFEGPIARIQAENVTTRRSWYVSRGLVAGADEQTLYGGQHLIVRTDPRRDGLAFEGPNGDSWYDSSRAVPDLWPLIPGEQQVRMRLDGATGDARATMTYTPSWASIA